MSKLGPVRRQFLTVICMTLGAALIILGIAVIGPVDFINFIRSEFLQLQYFFAGILIGAGVQVILLGLGMVRDWFAERFDANAEDDISIEAVNERNESVVRFPASNQRGPGQSDSSKDLRSVVDQYGCSIRETERQASATRWIAARSKSSTGSTISKPI